MSTARSSFLRVLFFALVLALLASARAEEDASIEEWGLVEGGHDVDQADIAVRLAAPRAMMSMLRAG